MKRISRAIGLLLAGVLASVTPALAQFSPVGALPGREMFSVYANDDTIAVGADTVTFVSTNAGATWARSAKPVSGVTSIQAVWVRDGRLYAGTFGKGVFVSDNLGATWSSFNEGLVGGILNSQLFIVDFAVRGDSLYAATAGAGVYLRSLVGRSTWQPVGVALEQNQASNVNALVLGGNRLLALAGANGMVFRNDPGETDWTASNLDNVGIHAGVAAQSAAFTGTAWVVGTNAGVFQSVAGQEPWTRFDPRLGPLTWTAFTSQKNHIYAAFVTTPLASVLEESVDDGATWGVSETEPGVFVHKLALGGDVIYAARADGLWRRDLDITGVPNEVRPSALRFRVAGLQPFGRGTSLRFELPKDEAISIELFDVQGRRVGEPIQGYWSSGSHQLPLDAQRLGSGVYLARLTAGGRHETVRLVHVR
jgi:photosystem II stability/assembly factor-like uncharacterized protein